MAGVKARGIITHHMSRHHNEREIKPCRYIAEGKGKDSEWKTLTLKHKPNLPRAVMQRFYDGFQSKTMGSKYTASCVCKTSNTIKMFSNKYQKSKI